MQTLLLHDFHAQHGAHFCDLAGLEAVSNYGDPLAEHQALRQSAAILDLSFRGRLCVIGADRQRFLHGQVTNDIKGLQEGRGCYAALVTAKGKMVSDLNIYHLPNEFLLDFEPGLSERVRTRLEHYVVADDVEVVDVGPPYGLLSVQGPRAAELVAGLGLAIPTEPMSFSSRQEAGGNDLYLMNQPRVRTGGFDLFLPNATLARAAEKLAEAAEALGGRLCGWEAFELARIEAGIPRYGMDMDESNLPPEAGLEERAISYNKGCYIGQEIINRIRTYGQVAKSLCGLRLAPEFPVLPARGDKLLKDNKEVGFITSAVFSPDLQSKIALGYVRREANAAGTELTLRIPSGESRAIIVPLPFR